MYLYTSYSVLKDHPQNSSKGDLKKRGGLWVCTCIMNRGVYKNMISKQGLSLKGMFFLRGFDWSIVPRKLCQQFTVVKLFLNRSYFNMFTFQKNQLIMIISHFSLYEGGRMRILLYMCKMLWSISIIMVLKWRSKKHISLLGWCWQNCRWAVFPWRKSV